MLNNCMAFLFAALFSISAFTSCATRIGNRSNIEETVFEVGTTTKNDVANALGLPMIMKSDNEAGTEYWAYRQKPALVSFSMATVDENLNATMSTTHNYAAYGDQFKEAAVIYTFDKNGVLIDVRDNQKQAN